MKLKSVKFSQNDVPITLEMEYTSSPQSGTLIGTAQMRAGQRVPVEGESVHSADEFSYVLRGTCIVEAGGEKRECGPGTLMLIPAGEGHVTTALDDVEVLWWWAGNPLEFTALKEQYPTPELARS